MMVRLLLIAAFCILSWPSFVQAQGLVNVRGKVHDDYSRLVFDLSSKSSYSIDQTSNGGLILSFKNKGALQGDVSDIQSLRNISGVTVLSEAPLKISLNIPKDSRIRDFLIGDRLILDVYNSPSQAQPSAKESRFSQAPAVPEVSPKTQTSTTTNTAQDVETPSTKPRDAMANLTTPPQKPQRQTDSPSVPAEATEESAAEDDASPSGTQASLPQPTQPIKIEKPSTPNFNVLALSDTQSFGMGAFYRNGEIIFVNDSDSFSIMPQIKGPQSKTLNPVKRIVVNGGIAFKTKALEGFEVQPSGGGLLWRIGITDQKKPRDAINPRRVELEDDRLRGGALLWPFDRAREVFTLTDDLTGQDIKVVTVDDAKQFAGWSREFVDFEILPSPIGLAVLPKVSDLEITIKDDGAVQISRPGGLTLVDEMLIAEVIDLREEAKRKAERASEWEKIYKFEEWLFSETETIDENRNKILASFGGVSDKEAVEGFLSLAKMYLAHGMGPEALGFSNLARDQLPGIQNNIEYKAITAAAKALSWHSQDAFFDLSVKDLEVYPEIGYWRAYVLADLGDWQQADKIMPRDLNHLFNYPDPIFNRLAIPLTEVLLRAGEVDPALEIIDELEYRKDSLLPVQQSGYLYLKGEAARQQENYQEAIKSWNELAQSTDDLYRTRATLALTRLSFEQNKITLQDEINHLERLRYAWRGDELEAQINYWLGKAYFDDEQYGRGLNILRESTTYAVGANLSQKIAAEMRDLYTELFLGDKLEELSPLDAAAIYEQFSELIPTGEQGDRVVERLAERLVDADLLDRATALLQRQLEYRLKGYDAYRVAVRLALLKLIDEQPGTALKVLERAEEEFKTLPPESKTDDRALELVLLRAQAMAFKGRPDLALKMLEEQKNNPKVNRLMADIAWSAGFWDDAGIALGQVIIDENISLTRPLSPKHATLILNRAVALNLSSDRIALANMREKYSDAMAQTDKAKIFEVVSRPRQSVSLADRETLMGIVEETDLFADFLENYSDFKNSPANDT